MKFEWNKKYTTIAAYACIVLTFAAVLFVSVMNIGAVWGFIVKFIKILNPVIVGYVIAFLINPLMVFCEKKLFAFVERKKKHPKLRRVLSLITAYLIVMILISLFIALLVPQIVQSYNDLASRFDSYATGAQEWVSAVFDKDKTPLPDWLMRFIDVNMITEGVNDLIKNSYNVIIEYSPHVFNFATNVINSLKNAFIGIIFSVFFLFSKEKFFAQVKKTTYAFFKRSTASRMVRMTRRTGRVFEGFVIGKIIDSVIIGILTFFVLMIFRMPYYPLVAVIVGVTNVIPFFGPIIGAIPGTFIIFIADPVKALWFLVIILAIQQLDGNVIGPAILGDKTNISSFWVIFAIVVMSGVLGVTGMFIGVPVFAVLYALFVEHANRLLIARGKSRRLINYYGKSYGKIPEKKKDTTD